MATYVLISGRLHRLEDQAAFEAAFEQVSRLLLSSVDGILRDELIHDSSDPYTYIMLSEWEDKQAWATWQRSPLHEQQVGHMQQYWQGQGVNFFESVFCVNRSVANLH